MMNEILKLHKEWLESDGSKGQRAYLQGANLQEADLRGAIIGRDHILSSSNFRYFELSNYYCYIFESERGLVMKIGCEVHLVEDWKNFTNKEILKMDGQRALSFWHKDKETLMRKCYDE